MPKANLSSLAETDLADICLYIAGENLSASDGWLQRIGQVFDLLASNPNIGEVYSAKRHSFRRFVVGNYVIYYTPSSEGITVYRVLHAARQADNLI